MPPTATLFRRKRTGPSATRRQEPSRHDGPDELYMPRYEVAGSDEESVGDGFDNTATTAEKEARLVVLRRVEKICFGILTFWLLGMSLVLFVILSSKFGGSGNQDDAGGERTLSETLSEYSSLLAADSIMATAKHLSTSPHVAGTDADYETALWVRDRMTEYGLDSVEIVTYFPLLSYPLSRKVRVQGQGGLDETLSLEEEKVEGDVCSKHPDAVPTYHGYAPSGHATGEVVYVNYGREDDFKHLVESGVNLTGKVALARYSKSFRGLKVKLAEEHGMSGVLLYSDPMDDGPVKGPAYPAGPWRPDTGVQRGSVAFLSVAAGDPLTVGEPALSMDDPPRNDVSSAAIPKIPSQPISASDARVIMSAMDGSGMTAPEDWEGGLGVSYYVTGSVSVEIELNMNFTIGPIWNVIGRIEGAVEPDRSVILGGHRDAWVCGASDPISGSAAMLETAKALGDLLRTGWRPRRSIIIASWDGEEFGLLGSTEWCEHYAEELKNQAVAYINVDGFVSGDFTASSSFALSSLIREVAGTVSDPASGESVLKKWKAHQSEGNVNGVNGKYSPIVFPLGSGSDYTAFVDYLGISSMHIEFDGSYGVYHSEYDSFNWMKTQGDPGYVYHKAISDIAGKIVLSLADSEILPFDPVEVGARLEFYFEDETAGLLTKAANHGVSRNFDGLRASYKAVQSAAKKLMDVMNDRKEGQAMSDYEIRRINDQLMIIERCFIHQEGLNGRNWYKNVIQAPGRYTGYAYAVYPELDEAIDDNDSDALDAAVYNLSSALQCAERVMLGGILPRFEHPHFDEIL